MLDFRGVILLCFCWSDVFTSHIIHTKNLGWVPRSHYFHHHLWIFFHLPSSIKKISSWKFPCLRWRRRKQILSAWSMPRTLGRGGRKHQRWVTRLVGWSYSLVGWLGGWLVGWFVSFSFKFFGWDFVGVGRGSQGSVTWKNMYGVEKL